MGNKITYSFLLVALLMFSCGDDDQNDLPPVEERVEGAIENLRNELTAPENGWRVFYQPNDLTGGYLILLDFDEDGEVRIQSDVAEDDGAYFDQTIPYRIDAELGLELIFETYGVFHYFFELQQTGFGGEFEFIYDRKEGNNLYFTSKSDFGSRTTLVMEPAGASDEGLFSRELAANLDASTFQDPVVTSSSFFQLVLSDRNMSVFFTLDTQYRLIKAHYAAAETSMEEILAGSENTELDYLSAFLLQNNALQLVTPLIFSLGGQQYSISSISLSNFQDSQTTYCSGSNVLNTSQFTAEVPGLGGGTFETSLFSGDTDFTSNGVYTINLPFILNENDERLANQILERLPDAYYMQMYYDYDIGDTTLNAVGFLLLDATNSAEFLLRSFEPTEFEGNHLSITFSDSLFTTKEFTEAEEQALIDLTDMIFEGGEMYMLDFAYSDEIFEMYNGCNDYKLFGSN